MPLDLSSFESAPLHVNQVLCLSLGVRQCPKMPPQLCHPGDSEDIEVNGEKPTLIAWRRLSKTACYPLAGSFFISAHKSYPSLHHICCPHPIIKASWLSSLPQMRAHPSCRPILCTLTWGRRSRNAIMAQSPFHRSQTSSSSPVQRIPLSHLPLHQARVP